jgi:hypothetical protein
MSIRCLPSLRANASRRAAGTKSRRRANLPDRASPALHEAASSRHDQGLAQRMGVPCRPRAQLERHAEAQYACRLGRLEQGVNAYT